MSLSPFTKQMHSIPILSQPDLLHHRSNEMVRFLLRNHVGTNETIRRVVVPEVQKPTAQKLIVRLIKRGLLKRWPLHASKSYLRLGSAAIARWQYPQSYSRRLGPQVLPYQLGCLSLMANSQPSIQRLLPEELAQAFPDFPNTRDLHQWAYYLDSSGPASKLVTVRVEYRVGGEAVINKVAEQLHRYRQHPCVNRLLDEQRFIVHVVTATAEQEMALWDAADRLRFPAILRTAHDKSLTLFL